MTVSNLAHYDIGIQVNPHNKNSKASLQPIETTGRELCGLSLARTTLLISMEIIQNRLLSFSPSERVLGPQL